MGYFGLSKAEGFGSGLTRKLFDWWVEREGLAYVEEQLTRVRAEDCCPKSVSSTNLGVWFSNHRDGYSESVFHHPLWKQAQELACQGSFGAFVLAEFRPDDTSYGPYLKTLGDLVLATEWWKKNGQVVKKYVKNNKKAEEVLKG